MLISSPRSPPLRAVRRSERPFSDANPASHRLRNVIRFSSRHTCRRKEAGYNEHDHTHESTIRMLTASDKGCAGRRAKSAPNALRSSVPSTDIFTHISGGNCDLAHYKAMLVAQPPIRDSASQSPARDLWVKISPS